MADRHTMKKAGRYNWKNQPERLVYIGRNWSGNGYWHQFEKVGEPGIVWCEVLDSDLHMIEESAAGVQETAQCPDCNGYGRVNDGSGARSPYGPKCPKCGGSGQVPAPTQDAPDVKDAERPLTDAVIKKMLDALTADKRTAAFSPANWFTAGITMAEAAHGIAASPTQQEPK